MLKGYPFFPYEGIMDSVPMGPGVENGENGCERGRSGLLRRGGVGMVSIIVGYGDYG